MVRLMRKLPKAGAKFPVLKFLLPLYALLAVMFAALVRRGNVQLLNPAGVIADEQSKLLWGVIIFAAVIGAIMISTVFVLAFRYRDDKNAYYTPEWHAGPVLQVIGWGIPFLALTAISVIVWITAHQLDPYKPIASTTKPLTIQVVALRWKWLFIYPEDRVATVNMLEIPTNTPVSFELTADAPMNSFWIPRLSGQIYAMTGMVTHLHVMATKTGTLDGGPAEISGDEFAGMEFKVHAVSPTDYAVWKNSAQRSAGTLNYANYAQLARPSADVAPTTYKLTESNLFDAIVMQFMLPSSAGGSN